MQDEKYSQLYERLMEHVTQQHKANQQRIRKGLWSLPCVTVLFLLLVMLTDGSRTIYLLLWIASVFALAAYLISVEYADYEMQKKLSDVTQLEQELGGLMDGSTDRTRRLLPFSGLQRNTAREEPTAEEAEAAEEAAAESVVNEEPAPAEEAEADGDIPAAESDANGEATAKDAEAGEAGTDDAEAEDKAQVKE